VKAKSLVQLSDKYTRYATVYGCLVIVGAILLGWNAGATVTCATIGQGDLTCAQDVQAWTFLIVTGTYALAGLLVVLPVYGVAHLMRALASLLADAEAPR
jgi:hypothetical protein